MRSWGRVFGVTLALASLTCGPSATPESGSTPEVSLDSLRTVVNELVGEPVCESAADCRAIAFGAKPCGGPWTYLPYSISVTDSARLSRAAARYDRREEELNRKDGRVSDCRYVPEPGLECREGRCTTTPR